MYIRRVTFTGADDSVNPLELSSRFTTLKENTGVDLEIALLVGREYTGRSRFPSKEWINRFLEAYIEIKENDDLEGVYLSTHLCGDYVKEFLLGTNPLITELPELWDATHRVQLNTHGIPHPWNPISLSSLILPKTSIQDMTQQQLSSYLTNSKDYIFQLDGVNDHIFQHMVVKAAEYEAVNPEDLYSSLVSGLFDLSHGAGIHTKNWPPPCYKAYWHGYAGGIGPENITETIFDIDKVCSKSDDIWIDMETKVRTNGCFDLGKVTYVVEQLSCYSNHGQLEETIED